MAALRAMLQLRTTSQSDSSSSDPHGSLDSTILSPPLQSSTGHPSATHSLSSASLHPSSSLNSNTTTAISGSTGTLGLSGAGAGTSAPALSKSMSPAKKPAPFQNLGLHSGAASGNLGLVKFALDNGQPIDSVLNGVYAIHAACCSNANVAVVLFLIERGADVNAKRLPRKYSNEKGVQTVGTTGSTPLHFAAANGCLAVVDILLRHGAIVDMTDKYGSSPLSVAAARNHPEVASLLRQYSAMQRGVQDLTPDTEAKDPFADRRGSCDVHRGAAIVIPPVRPTATHQKETSSQSLLIPAVRASSSTRSPGQRRISLPSIIESPSSPNVSAPPRQSCDFDRTPQSTEPLVRSTASIRSTPSQPTRNITLTPTKMAERPVKTLMRGPSDPSLQTTPSKEPTSRSMRRSHTAQSGTATPTSYLTAPEPTSMKRRKSMESAALLSPQSAQAISRRKSFDQLSSLTRPDSKSRRSSDASSTTSQKTTSSGTTTRTSLSDHRPESIHNGMEAGSNSSNNSSSSVNSANSRSSNKKSSMATHHPHHQSVDPGNAMDQPFLLAPSLSQSTLESSRPKRPPVSFAMDVTARQSLDLQRLAMNLDRTADKDRNMEPKNDSETDLPSLLFRRRTMQETQHPKLSNMALRYHSVGPVMEALNGSSISDEYQAHQLQRSNGSSSSLQDMSGGASDIGGERGGLGVHRNSIGSAPSGSATVSGRFSRMWTTSNASSKENLNVPEFGEMQLGGEVGGGIGQGPPSSPGLARSDNSRSRGSMLNRLSGIWSRR